MKKESEMTRTVALSGFLLVCEDTESRQTEFWGQAYGFDLQGNCEFFNHSSKSWRVKERAKYILKENRRERKLVETGA